MMNIVLLLAILLCTTSVHLFAQEVTPSPPRHQFEIGITQASGYWKDIAYSPLNYRVQRTSYQISYWRENQPETAIFRAAAFFGTGQVSPSRSELSLFTSDYTAGNIAFDYLKRVPEKVERLRVFVGPQYQLYVGYFDFQGQDSFSFIASHTLNAAALLQYSLGNRHTIGLDASLALAGWLVRPPYAGYNTRLLNNFEEHPVRLVFDGGRFSSLHNYYFTRWKIDYQFALISRVSVALNYTFNYQRVSDQYHPFTQATNQIGGGLIFTL
ncbi:hypothetical protein [Tunicatimonas pelagia]|uniref:hypothetical protein n=1 Tax=Tunicatimonas pelagia TaxID=931531 RepID=UPI0026668ED9|nr:hypothetical protein [Tunicatimonas pelagia]WKN43469.1 hypothetical protein P0M28_00610 [Tunicatimonas pelagia]